MLAVYTLAFHRCYLRSATPGTLTYMQLSQLIASGLLIATFGILSSRDASDEIPSEIVATATTPILATQTRQDNKATANGHYVLVIEGNRDGLAVTFARKKDDQWAGIPKGLSSNWRVSILDDKRQELATIPIDVSSFATDVQSLGQPARVQGCMVVDSKIGLLLNVPAFAAATNYVFSRTEPNGQITKLGTTSAPAVRELAGGGR